MPSVTSALVVGAGIAGTASAILLAQAGVEVDLVDISPALPSGGSGITLQGAALRVLDQLGVWEEVRKVGYSFDLLGLRAPDAHGTLLAQFPDARTGGPDLPATCGALRPDLARILLERAVEVGVAVRFSTTLVSVTQLDDGVDVSTGDGDTRRYDVVIGADGIRSWTRRQLGVELETRSTGMGIWRVYGPRPESMTCTDLIYGGASYIAGYCPTSETTMYAYIVERAQDRSALTPQQQLATVKELSQAYHGPWDEIRAGLAAAEQVNYTFFEHHLLPAPWNRGRVVLVGDAVHACPPTLALGGAMALEDAAVLAELLVERSELDQVLFDDYAARRIDRVRLVVESSVQLCQWLIDHTPGADVPGLMKQVNDVVAVPA